MAKRKRRHSDGKPKIIANMGLFWYRDVVWADVRKGFTKNLWGYRAWAKREGRVDFWKQAGIYALYADYHLIYVGQAGMGDKSCIGDRLYGHTKYSSTEVGVRNQAARRLRMSILAADFEVQWNACAAAFHSSTNWRIRRLSSSKEPKSTMRKRRRCNRLNHCSTWFSQEQPTGVKCA